MIKDDQGFPGDPVYMLFLLMIYLVGGSDGCWWVQILGSVYLQRIQIRQLDIQALD